jgi:hypothetical protein
MAYDGLNRWSTVKDPFNQCHNADIRHFRKAQRWVTSNLGTTTNVYGHVRQAERDRR